MRSLRAAAVVAALVVGLVSTPSAVAQSAGTLAGEQLLAVASETEIFATCDPDGTSTITFTAEGVAIGPYPGTFFETGTVTIGPQVGPPADPGFGEFSTGPVLSFDSHFTIDSALGQVTGSKELNLLLGGAGFCAEFDGRDLPLLANATGFAAFTFAQLRYEAQIHDSHGTTFVEGDAGGEIQKVDATAPNEQGGTTGFTVNHFFEPFFTSTVVAGTPGKVTGGGEILRSPTDPTEKVSFGLTAQEQSTDDLQGKCSVVDHATRQQFHCLDVETIVVTPTHATFTGDARVIGPGGEHATTTYRIDVDDVDESGIARDTFKFQTDSGYSAEGPLTSGNIQIHKPDLG